MLVYTDTSILEIRPQQIIEADKVLNHPYLKQIITEKPPAVKKKPIKKLKEIDNGNDR
tara:strand:- start:7622 stop:7795 length:174 start_codon:yes stop_codon:yes gene_type:complete